jgi:hypothetical protein
MSEFRFSFTSDILHSNINWASPERPTDLGNWIPLNGNTLTFHDDKGSSITTADLLNVGIDNNYNKLIPSLKTLGAVIDKFSVNVSIQGIVAFATEASVETYNLPDISYRIRVKLVDDNHLFYIASYTINGNNDTCYNIVDFYGQILDHLYVQNLSIDQTIDMLNIYDFVFTSSPSFISFNVLLDSNNNGASWIVGFENPFVIGNIQGGKAKCPRGNYSSGQQIYTNLDVNVTFNFQGHFICSSSNIFSTLCKIAAPCNENKGKACEDQFEKFEDACNSLGLINDDCFQFIKGYYKYATQGKSSAQIDNYIKNYCNNIPDILTKFNDPEDNLRVTQLCGCHLSDDFYSNFSKQVSDIAKENHYDIDPSLFGLKKKCLFPACTVSPFPSQGITCNNKICFNNLQIDRNGSIKKIDINQNCIIQSQRRPRVILILGRLLITDEHIIIMSVLAIIVFVSLLILFLIMKTRNRYKSTKPNNT